MLVLTRKINETICIGDSVEVKVLSTHGDRVKLGFVGPPEVAIHRQEVLRRIEADAAGRACS